MPIDCSVLVETSLNGQPGHLEWMLTVHRWKIYVWYNHLYRRNRSTSFGCTALEAIHPLLSIHRSNIVGDKHLSAGLRTHQGWLKERLIIVDSVDGSKWRLCPPRWVKNDNVK